MAMFRRFLSTRSEPVLADAKIAHYAKKIDSALRSDLNIFGGVSGAAQRADLERIRFDVESLAKYGVYPKCGNGLGVKTTGMQISFRSFDKHLLHSFVQRLAQKSVSLGVDSFSIVPMPMKRRIWTVLSSPFVDKEARTQLEMRVYHRLVVIKNSRQQKNLNQDQFDHLVDMARVHRLIDVFLRFIPGIQVTFHHELTRTT